MPAMSKNMDKFRVRGPDSFKSKGFICWGVRGVEVRSKGLWPECVLGKCQTDASENRVIQSYVASILSSLSNI